MIDTLEPGGAERSLQLIGERLDRRRFALTVCHVYPGDRLREPLERCGVRVISLNVRGKYGFAAALRKLNRVVREEKPDLMHTSLFRADQVGRAIGRFRGVPVISSFVNISYDPSRLANNPYINPYKLAGLRCLDRLTARWVSKFHAVSETVKTSNCKYLGVAAERVAVVPRGREDRWGDAPRGTRRPPRIPEDRSAFPRILTAGRLVDQKGHRFLLAAMPDVLREMPDAELLIAGEGGLRGELEQLTRKLALEDRVRFLGHRDDLAEWLPQADVFAFPSLYEGLPGALVEAMLAGCAVVASDIPVIHELVEDGVTGALAAPASPAEIARRIVELARDSQLRHRLASAARDRALQHFEINQVVRQMEQFYDEVARDAGIPRDAPSAGEVPGAIGPAHDLQTVHEPRDA